MPSAPFDLEFTTPFLRDQYSRAARTIQTGGSGMFSADHATVFALHICLDSTQMLSVKSGDDSADRKEVLSHLTSPTLRTGLKQFYSDISPEEMNPVARAFRERLCLLCGERI